MKRIVLTSLVLIITILLSACSNESSKKDDYICVYNGEEYRSVSQLGLENWSISTEPTIYDKAYFGEENGDTSRKNADIKVFNKKSLNMFIEIDDPDIGEPYCKVGSVLPSIEKDFDKITGVKITFSNPNIATKVLSEKNKIEGFLNELISSQNKEYESFIEGNNAVVTIKFSSLYAEYTYGYLCYTNNKTYFSPYGSDHYYPINYMF